MKPRARRIALAAAVLGMVLLAVLVLTNWPTVRDHVEAWHFQLTRETRTIEPLSSEFYPMEEHLLHFVADRSRCSVIVDSRDALSFYGLPRGNDIREILESGRPRGAPRKWRILEQRFPRRAYVVIRDTETVVEQPHFETFVIPGAATRGFMKLPEPAE